MRRLVGVVIAALGAACSSPSYRAELPCSDRGECPPGQVCGVGLVCAPERGYEPAGAADLIFLDFTPAGGSVLRNLAGNGWEFDESAMAVEEGAIGSGVEFPESWMDVERGPTPALFSDQAMTIEMWIRPESTDGEQPLFGDYSADRSPQASYYLFLDDATLGFASNQGCNVDHRLLDPAGPRITAGEWQHVAASWDGTRMVFFVDGVPSQAAELDIVPCYVGLEEIRIGRRSDSDTSYLGAIDELKVSSFAKGAADLAVSMELDSAAPRCGNGRIDAGEDCDGVGLCCDLATCASRDGQACGDGVTCDGLLCRGDGERSINGVAALYRFDENGGEVISDSSGLATAIDLVIDDVALATWSEDGLTMDGTFAVSTGSTVDLVAACRASNEMTIEAWLTPHKPNSHDDIVCFAAEGGEIFELEQQDDSYQAQFETSESADGSKPEAGGPIGDVTNAPTHVVATRAASGERTIYVNGVPRSRSLDRGDFSGWSEQPLILGLDGAGDVWEGTFHLVALYCRALDERRVARHFAAGG